MRCPKCQYISFDSGERCRNCGYEFSLTTDTRPVDLPIHTGDEPIGPLHDFALDTESRRTDSAATLADTIGTRAKPVTSSFDLPLFRERKAADSPAKPTPTVTPRPPLAVRRSTPVTPKPLSRSPTDEPSLDLDHPDSTPRRASANAVPAGAAAVEQEGTEMASLVPRCLAAIVDIAILLAIGWIVLYLTLKICGLPFSRLAAIPAAPFAAFLLLIAGGYLTLFTAAGGQTIGKMATGIRVVSMDQDVVRVPLGRAILRAVVYFVSALPAGIGFLPALVGADRRAIHDRLADTRVVKA